jgi:hypothetical protein
MNPVDDDEVTELLSLGVDPSKIDYVNDKKKLAALIDGLKRSLFEDYRAAYPPEDEQDEVIIAP